MNQAFWIGVYPGLTPEMLAYIIETIREAPKELANPLAVRNSES
jgi:dTDP-4-amino-4,6-dideoxygalactose transaminase